MSENTSEKKMSMVCEASGLVRQIAAPATGKAALLRAYRRLGSTWTYNRVKDVYYADERIRISGEEIDKLRVTARKEVILDDPSIKELRDQLAVVVRHLRAIDPTFCDPLVEALGRSPHPDGGEEDTTSGKIGEIGNA
jgi:hypothetical protein